MNTPITELTADTNVNAFRAERAAIQAIAEASGLTLFTYRADPKDWGRKCGEPTEHFRYTIGRDAGAGYYALTGGGSCGVHLSPSEARAWLDGYACAKQ